MNITMKRSIGTTIIFGIMFFFLVLYFIFVGPENFLLEKIHSLINAVVIALSMVSFALLLLLTNKKSNIVDERDLQIQKKASSVGLLGSLMYVFLLSISLFVIYRNQAVAPTSWMWFIAYSTFAFGYFFTSLMHIFMYQYEE